MSQEPITIDGKTYSFVKARNHNPICIYRGTDTYLRIGPKVDIAREIAYHRNLAAHGFPIPAILSEGIHGELHFFIESSVGDYHFGEIFRAQGAATAEDFENFLHIVEQFLEAQVTTIREETYVAGQFDKLIQAECILAELPALNTKIESGLQKMHGALKTLPMVFTHADFNPYNIFPRGVIDWERGTVAPLGYDIVTNISQSHFFPPNGDYEYTAGHYFSSTQKQEYWRRVSIIQDKYGVPDNTIFQDHFIFARSIWSVVRMERWPKIQAWRYAQFEHILDAYLNDQDLMTVLEATTLPT